MQIKFLFVQYDKCFGSGKPSLEREQTRVSSDGPVYSTGLQEQLRIVQTLMPKHFPLGRNFMSKHFLYIWKTIYHEGIYPSGCNPAHLQHQHPSTGDSLSFNLGDKNPPSITQV